MARSVREGRQVCVERPRTTYMLRGEPTRGARESRGDDSAFEYPSQRVVRTMHPKATSASIHPDTNQDGICTGGQFNSIHLLIQLLLDNYQVPFTVNLCTLTTFSQGTSRKKIEKWLRKHRRARCVHGYTDTKSFFSISYARGSGAGGLV
jgi:hypothetical protein